jgi:UDP-N-acetylmuramyl pentapeptide phosphotransferase/UDP-N-acetylglucosamine-1-phosphate transferase
MNAALPAALFAAAAVLSFAGVRAALAFATSKALLDHPTERSSHTVPTPRGGGLGIVAAIALCAVGAGAYLGDLVVAAAALPVVLVCGVGFADDRSAMRPFPKMLLVLGAAATALPFATVREVEVPFAGTVALGPLALPLSLFWVACFANAFNFMDGINGISGLTALVSGLAFAAAGFLADDVRIAVLGAVTAGAAAGFLPWNFPAARIFMGDSGSLPLGMLLAILAAGAAEPASSHAAPTLPFPASVLLLGPYLFDVTLTLVRRAREGKPLGQAHKEHLYQRLARRLGGHAPSALVFAGLAAATSVLALLYGGLGDLGRLVSLLTPLACLLASARALSAIESGAAPPEP